MLQAITCCATSCGPNDNNAKNTWRRHVGKGNAMAQYCDLVALLRAVPLFAKLDPIKLKLLPFSSSYLSLETGEVLFHEGEVADSVYIIDEGEAEIIIGKGCDEVRTGKLGKHGLVGEKEVFCNQPRSATIRAAGTLKVVRLDADVFLRIVSENVGVALGVLQILSDKLASKECSASGAARPGRNAEQPEHRA